MIGPMCLSVKSFSLSPIKPAKQKLTRVFGSYIFSSGSFFAREPPPPVQGGGGVELAQHPVTRKEPSVLRARAGCGDRPEDHGLAQEKFAASLESPFPL